MSIEGIPEGWELVKVGKPIINVDCVVAEDGMPVLIDWVSDRRNWLIIRKIEKPKQYRAFANAAEFRPHRDRWWRYSDSEDSGHVQPPAAYSDIGPMGSNWKQAFEGRQFDDGSPFGVEVAS